MNKVSCCHSNVLLPDQAANVFCVLEEGAIHWVSVQLLGVALCSLNFLIRLQDAEYKLIVNPGS